ncbi:hypothetical protein SO802_023972 [Lithocarpus litseifolius]|uniref:DUF4283 domain-containing protein n=1 Tax=Lithocarpus litseifolius TaxID=425828 RepID=A0AAW2C7T2_9ROSI
MDQEVVHSLEKLKLTKEEEEDIVIANISSYEIFEECSLSLFGRLLTDCHQNQRPLKNTLKAAWKMDSDLRIVEVGSNILQFKFNSRLQSSTAKINDCIRMELSGTWEPPDSSSVARAHAMLEAQNCLPVEDKAKEISDGKREV